jgi:hypothetical protein
MVRRLPSVIPIWISGDVLLTVDSAMSRLRLSGNQPAPRIDAFPV